MTMQAEFEGRHIVVTGGTGALGTAIVDRLVRAGATCHIPAPFEGEGSEAERVHITRRVDLTDEDAARAYYASLPPLWASIHAAGGFAMASVVDTSLAQFDAMYRLNAVTCFLSCREAIRAMRPQGGGRIVNVAARPAVSPTGGLIAYTTSKAAVASMTQCLAEEVRGEDILVNAVLPSIIDSPANRAGMPDANHQAWPTPAQIAEAVSFLASPRNELTWGALVPVYGRA
jgi:NAD(P)-dependent dehydrogenase (short-subunit alcohol dehydrogenase family)